LRTMQHVGYGVSIRRAAGAWAAGFSNERTTGRGLAAARALGLETAVYTVNEPGRMLDLERLGAGAIFTDRPALALLALRRPSARGFEHQPDAAMVDLAARDVDDGRLEPVHRADELRHERRRRGRVHLRRLAHLLDPVAPHDGDVIGDGERLLLVVRDVERG